MKLSRQIGSANEPLWVFVQDATVSTGAGLANVVASSVSFGWCRSDQAAVSSGTCTTGTLGTYGVSSFVQASSTAALGFYQFSPPNGIYTSGSSAIIILSGAPSMAPLPIEIELTKTNNQLYTSTQTISTALNLTANADKTGYSGAMSATSVTVGVNASSVTGGVNVTSVVGTAAVTSSAGIMAHTWDLGRTANLTSTLALTGVSVNQVTSIVNVDKAGYGVSSVTAGVNVTSVVGTAAVTSSAGILAFTFDLGRTANPTSTLALTGLSLNQVTSLVNVDKAGYGVSSVTAGVNVSSIVGTAAVTTQAGILATVFDLARTANPNSTVTFSSFAISSQSVTVGSVDVSSFAGSAIVTTAAGVIATAFDLGRTLNATSTVSFTGVSINQVVSSVTLPIAEHAAISDKLLGRTVSGSADGGRTVSQSLYVLRNKVDVSAGIVYETDDLTSSWAFSVSTQAGNPIVSISPV